MNKQAKAGRPSTTHCIYGHLKTRIPSGRLVCLECQRKAVAKYKALRTAGTHTGTEEAK